MAQTAVSPGSSAGAEMFSGDVLSHATSAPSIQACEEAGQNVHITCGITLRS